MGLKCFSILLLATIIGTEGYTIVERFEAATKGSGWYCAIDDKGGYEECSDNDIPPDDFQMDTKSFTNEFTCLKVSYKVKTHSKEEDIPFQQCLHRLKDNQDICKYLRSVSTITINDCSTTVPSLTPPTSTTSTTTESTTTKSTTPSSTTKSTTESTTTKSTTPSTTTKSTSESTTTKSTTPSTTTKSTTESTTTKSTTPSTTTKSTTTQSTKTPATTVTTPTKSTKVTKTTKTTKATTESTSTTPTTPEPASGVFCVSSDSNEVVECDKDNSKLPKDIAVDPKDDVSTDYICIDVKVKTGLWHKTETEIKQCALQLSKGDLCDEIKKNKYVEECNSSEPTTTTAQPETTTQAAPSLTSSFTISTLLVLFVYYLQ